MRERKYVKFRVDMFEDTKFKMIDRMPERDVIFYIWTRIVALTGKVNLEGSLYISKNIPYTIETLAIEFNRDVDQVQLALDTFIKLEMVEVSKDNIYKVKNFAKHQNIKVKSKDIEEEIREEAIQLKSEETKINVNIDNKELENKKKETDNNSNEKKDDKEEKNNIDDKNKESEFIITNVNQNDNITDKVNNNSKSTPILLEIEKSKKSSKRKRKNIDIKVTDENINDDSIVSIYDGDKKPLGKDETVVGEWAF